MRAPGAVPRRRVLITTSTLPRHEGDPEPRFVLDLARALPDRYEVTLLAPSHPSAKEEESLDGIRVLRYRYFPLRSLERLAYPGGILPKLSVKPHYWGLVPCLLLGLRRAVRRLLLTGGFSCVHCHWFLPQGLVQASCFSERGDPPFVVTGHGGDLHGLRGALVRRQLGRIAQRASAITVVSQALLRHVVDDLRLPVSEGRLHVIPMGVDVDRFGSVHRDEDWPERHGLARPLVLFVGRLVEKKGVSVLLEALADDRLRSRGVCLAVVGRGPLECELAARTLELGLTRRVRFLGPIPHRELPVAYASADLLCAPSVVARDGDMDGLPTVLLEAFASGLPCVASRLGGIPDLVEDGVSGRLVPPGDSTGLARALAEFLDRAEDRSAYARAAFDRSRRYAWSRIADEHARVYDQVVPAPWHRTGAR